MKQSFEYRPEVDGLRGVSILLVVIYHFFPKALPGGFIGVDIFFVISGFLITGISRSRYLDAKWSILSFYSARIRRLFPSLLLDIAFSLLIGWYSLLPSEYLGLARHAKAGLGFFENFVLSRESGYFGGTIGLKPLAHLWSLSIEEQFYLMFPLLVLFTKGWERHGIKIMTLILLGSFLTNLYRTYIVPSDVYLAPATRFWELMSGAVLSLLHTKTPKNKSNIRSKERSY
jgi:peptidoglycan/LPS O-acetylase OafA/YrhL